jgi:hypothetical protein
MEWTFVLLTEFAVRSELMDSTFNLGSTLSIGRGERTFEFSRLQTRCPHRTRLTQFDNF